MNRLEKRHGILEEYPDTGLLVILQECISNLKGSSEPMPILRSRQIIRFLAMVQETWDCPGNPLDEIVFQLARKCLERMTIGEMNGPECTCIVSNANSPNGEMRHHQDCQGQKS